MHLGQLMKEIILLLMATHIIWFLLPRWVKKSITGITRLVYKSSKSITLYVKRHYKEYYKQNKKVIPPRKERPSNVITITYPNGTVKKYPKAK